MFWVALVLGVVEGLTEFLPVSSTGHLIVTSHLLGFEGERAELFEICIQLGAILAVVWEYRKRLVQVVLDLPRRVEARRFSVNVLIAFLPSAVIGFLAYDLISEYLFSTKSVAYALIAGAIMIFVVEKGVHVKVHTNDTESINWHQALGIGFAQCLALWPGFSRSASTILGGLGAGLERRTATEFSFFLAIPTMFGATIYSFAKRYEVLEAGDLGWLTISFLVSFLVAWASIRWLLRWVGNHTFLPFAYYRLLVGILILLFL